MFLYIHFCWCWYVRALWRERLHTIITVTFGVYMATLRNGCHKGCCAENPLCVGLSEVQQSQHCPIHFNIKWSSWLVRFVLLILNRRQTLLAFWPDDLTLSEEKRRKGEFRSDSSSNAEKSWTSLIHCCSSSSFLRCFEGFIVSCRYLEGLIFFHA